MRRTWWMATGIAALGAVSGVHAAGCFFPPPDCELGFCLDTLPSGTGGGHVNPACSADPTRDPGAVIDDCGVFVSATAAPGGDGTKVKPFASFADAAEVKPTRIYACAEDYSESTGVSFSDGVAIYAGFTDCSGSWTWSAIAKATLNGPHDAVALTLDGGENRIENLSVTAADAVVDGGSSIAIVANGGTLDMVNGELKAGNAKDGAAGAELVDDPRLNGEPGAGGIGVCMAGAQNPGPEGITKMCANGGSSTAGDGGAGGEIVASVPAAATDGGDGLPVDATFPMKGLGGTGEGQGDPAAVECSSGSDGASGAAGDSGAGATGIGSISVTGYAGTDGTSGTNGKPGQGGGGGGGAKGGTVSCLGGPATDRAGASGGAGGTGGCGGRGGGGGQAGGSSITLVVLDSAVTLTKTTLTAGRAGNGGRGGNGQAGGRKGTGGASGAGTAGSNDSCGGGDGGTGGSGGPGGGGQGGHSLGIALRGTTPPSGGDIIIDPQRKSSGGAGGTGNTSADGGKGADGAAESCWDFWLLVETRAE
jgi:hypothetical protein